MRFHTRFDRWTALLLTTIGCAALVDCGGRETDEEAGGAGGAAAGGSGGDHRDGGAGPGGMGGNGGQGGSITTGGGPPNPTPGRPFLIDGTARQASVCRNDAWQAANLGLQAEHLDADQRVRLTHAWTQTALLEHASIAAFARFTLQLLALGAPASLVEAANAAIADETTHARLAFAVASAYAGHALGPSALSIEKALEATSLREVVVGTIREGCLGETVSAVQATETLAHVTDPSLRRVLTTIADDETRHAQLAWRFVQWALEQGDENVRHAARAEFARAAGEIALLSSEPLDAGDLDLLAGGAMPPRLGQQVRDECVRSVILPCADALFARTSRASAPRAGEVRA